MRTRFSIAAAWPIALLLAAISLGGLVTPAYAREQPAWIAQAIGQDWFDLVIAAPWLAWCGWRARRGSLAARVLLAGAYAYVVYELAIYAFAVHFNALFPLYCATFGLAGYALIALVTSLPARAPSRDRATGGFLVAIAAAFALLWLGEDVPAIARGTAPTSLAETGLLTNPVHVMDLSFVLPAHVLAGVACWRGRRGGALFAAILLAFGVLMSSSIGGMLIVMRTVGPAIPMFAVAGLTATMLCRVVRRL